MTFQATVLATLIGACTGAIVGALAAWLFAFDLRRREQAAAGRARLDAAVADVVLLLGELSGATQSFVFSLTLASPSVPASPLTSHASGSSQPSWRRAWRQAVTRVRS